MADNKKQELIDIVTELGSTNFNTGTDEEKAAKLKDFAIKVKTFAGGLTASDDNETMQDIVDKHAKDVDTSGVEIPPAIKIQLDSDLQALDKIIEADAANRDAVLDTIKTIGSIIITVAPLLLA